MPFFKTANIQLKESRVFQLRLGSKTLTIVLVVFDLNGLGIDTKLTLELTAPIMPCYVEPTAWNLLWPEMPQPPGWHGVHVHANTISLQPIMAKSVGGGIIAYYAPEERIPVLGRTHATWLNDRPEDPSIDRTLAVTLDSILSNMTPRLPIPMLTTAATMLVPGDLDYYARPLHQSTSKYSTKVLQRREPRYRARFIGAGVCSAVIMVLIFWFTAQHKAKTA